MKKLCEKGFKISSVDKKALEHYLLVTPRKWAEDALAGMVNKSIKIILRDYFELYKSKIEGNISADISIIIPEIIKMKEFKPYKFPIPEIPTVERKEKVNEEIWEGGFDLKDYEKQALEAYYEDPEKMLVYFMENKIYQRRKAFVKEKEQEIIKDPNIKEMPAKQDDFINLVCSKPNYKNRKQSEE